MPGLGDRLTGGPPPPGPGLGDRLRWALEAAASMQEPSRALYEAKHRRAQGLPPETSFLQDIASLGPRAVGGAQKMWEMAPGALGALWEDPLGTIDRAGQAGQAATDAIVGGAATPFTQFGDPSVDPVENAFDLASVLGAGGLATAGGRSGVGVFGGRLAKTADIGKLTRATDMKNGGFTPEEIWKETGWFQGADDRWRFEIPDEKAKLHAYGREKIAAGTEVPAGKLGVFTHPELYEAYPQLKDVGLHGRVSPGSIGTQYGGNIGLAPGGPHGMTKTLLHEMQHEVQDIEGFARGGSSREYAHGPMFDRKARELQGDLSKELTGGLAHPVQDIVKDIQYGNLNRFEEIARKHGFNTIGDAISFLKKQDEMRTPYGQYRRLAGETEARAVELRKDLDPETRRAVAPFKSEDVPREQQIVRFGTGGGAQQSVRETKFGTPFSSIKRDRPIEETTATYAPAPGQQLQDVIPFDFKNLKEGDYIVPFLGDRSGGEGLLTGVNDTKFRKPVPQEGGSDYLRRPGSPLWASDPGVISKYQNIIRQLQGLKGTEKGDIWGATVGMGPQSLDYSVQSVRTMMQQIKKQPLSAEAKKVFDKRMREEWTDFKGYENWPGIDKVSDKWWRLAGSARTKAMKLMDSKQMRDLGGPDVAAARWANTHPELRGDLPFLATGHGWTKVGHGPVQSAIDPEDWHSSYRAKLFAPGSEYAGRSPLIPGEKAFADWGEGAQGLKDTSQKQKSFTTKKVFQRLTPDVLQGIADYLASPEGMKLGIAGAIAAGLLTAEEAMGLAGMRGGSERSEQRPAA